MSRAIPSSCVVWAAALVMIAFIAGEATTVAWGQTSKDGGKQDAAEKKSGGSDKAKAGDGAKDKAKKPPSPRDPDDEGDPDDEKEPAEEDEPAEDDEYGAPRPKSIDESFVRDKLEAYLHATELKIQKDGKARIVFDFFEKDHAHDTAFTPAIATSLDSTFRWTVERDEEWTTYTSGKRVPKVVGVKASNSGSAYLNCWFTDDVEVQADFLLAATFSKKNSFALVFANDAKQPLALGSNVGTQCVTFKKGAPTKTQGTVEPLIFRNSTALKLKVKGGQFEAIRDKRSRQKMKYEPKDFPSGRIGFLWSGGVTGIITRIEVVGQIDWKRMALEIREKAAE